MVVQNATQYCRLVENVLGWSPPRRRNDKPWTGYAALAKRVNEKITTDPVLFTWANLELAVELLRREKLPRNPLGVFAHVARAVKPAVESESDVEVEIRKAIAYEVLRGDPGNWEVRFARVHPSLRAQTLDEWRESVL